MAILFHRQCQTSARLSSLDCTLERSGARSCLGSIYKLANKALEGQAQSIYMHPKVFCPAIKRSSPAKLSGWLGSC